MVSGYPVDNGDAEAVYLRRMSIWVTPGLRWMDLGIQCGEIGVIGLERSDVRSPCVSETRLRDGTISDVKCGHRGAKSNNGCIYLRSHVSVVAAAAAAVCAMLSLAHGRKIQNLGAVLKNIHTVVPCEVGSAMTFTPVDVDKIEIRL